ncbi:hypothetical protein CVM73_35455 [Bradyrhizobium forestalis]|uniref:Transposase DDE domain-containing protein n=1 Tax=Bradyrhizobium forestalis TaxID=1419263 RepID=A0A2M8QYF2_9BRAD|nr:hypothetical protein CVM73_35455 [Bradyrhizobium forestalis]
MEQKGLTALSAPSLALRGLPRRSQDLALTGARYGVVMPNMKIQAYLTAAAINLKRLAAALLALILPWIVPHSAFAASDRAVARVLTREP